MIAFGCRQKPVPDIKVKVNGCRAQPLRGVLSRKNLEKYYGLAELVSEHSLYTFYVSDAQLNVRFIVKT